MLRRRITPTFIVFWVVYGALFGLLFIPESRIRQTRPGTSLTDTPIVRITAYGAASLAGRRPDSTSPDPAASGIGIRDRTATSGALASRKPPSAWDARPTP